jgi:hypothetical protein
MVILHSIDIHSEKISFLAHFFSDVLDLELIRPSPEELRLCFPQGLTLNLKEGRCDYAFTLKLEMTPEFLHSRIQLFFYAQKHYPHALCTLNPAGCTLHLSPDQRFTLECCQVE